MSNFNFKERLKTIEWQGLLWNAIGWFFLLFGIMDLFLLHRLGGILGIGVGSVVLITNWMKKNKVGPFNPKPKIERVTEKVTDKKEGVTVSQVIALVIMCAIGIAIIYYAWGWHMDVERAMRQNCKMCSAFQKDCPYTDKELQEQEYGDGPCGDMSTYELLWKFSFVTVFIGIMPIFISIAATVPWLRKKVFVE
jgi:hypothetical protein